MPSLISGDKDLEGYNMVIYSKWWQVEGVLEKEYEQA